MSQTMQPLATREPQIQQRPEQAYLGIRRQVTTGVPDVVDTAFPELFGWLSTNGIEPAGPPLLRVHEVDRQGEPLELDVGVPVAPGTSGDGPVRADVLPAGRYATLLHTGPYRSATERDLGAAQAALVEWTREQGIACSHATERGRALPGCVEYYWIGPAEDPDYSKWTTELAWLILTD